MGVSLSIHWFTHAQNCGQTVGGMLQRKFDYTLKIVIVGESGVGKTCFLVRYIRDIFDEESQPTLGVEFMTRVVQTEKHNIQLQLWDTAGQELFRSVTRGYYRGSAGAFLVFDLTSRSSFENIERWLRDVKDVARSDVVMILIGSKADLIDRREVKAEEAETYAKNNGMEYFETSAKTGAQINEAISALVNIIEKHVDEGAYELTPATDPSPSPEPETDTGCKC